MGQLNLILNKVAKNGSMVVPKKKGPPNRMNDLPYREWMKFQKSFFRYTSDQTLLKECIEFFTKATWSDGNVSKSLVVNFNNFDPNKIEKPRVVNITSGLKSMNAMLDYLTLLVKKGEKYDFIIIDLRNLIKNQLALRDFLLKHSNSVFSSMRKLLVNDRYCGIVIGEGNKGATKFPIAWSVAQASRSHLKLRDEKIALIEDTKKVFYVLFMQASNDERKGFPLKPEEFSLAGTSTTIPSWIIPKPPPRKKNEILHPAKFPETLIEKFIELFTNPSDSVFDPMVGTGSAVIAAMRKGRNGFGLELNHQYAEIAAKRVSDESISQDSLFRSKDDQIEGRIFEGDALRISDLPSLRGKKFQYVITSPPYWSMLTNPGSENQEARRKRYLPLTYSKHKCDLGNIQDYDRFMGSLEKIYSDLATYLSKGGLLTIIVKNIKRNHVLYPLAWDLTARLCGKTGEYEYVGTTFWCQDDVGLKPFAVGIYWVSNILHQYCIHFRKR